jgi:hypothetical protein
MMELNCYSFGKKQMFINTMCVKKETTDTDNVLLKGELVSKW